MPFPTKTNIYPYNYTDTLEKVLGIKKVIHIHGDVDLPYIGRIAESVHQGTQWRIYCHKPEDEVAARKTLLEIGIEDRDTSYPASNAFWH